MPLKTLEFAATNGHGFENSHAECKPFLTHQAFCICQLFENYGLHNEASKASPGMDRPG
jgi:hypothetical protein